MTKMGAKRTGKRKPMNKTSKKLQAKLPGYNSLVKELREACGNRSELSGDRNDWRNDFDVEPHHVTGRTGEKLTDVFNIIMLTRNEHLSIQANNTFEGKRELLAYIKPIRIKQGYEEQI